VTAVPKISTACKVEKTASTVRQLESSVTVPLSTANSLPAQVYSPSIEKPIKLMHTQESYTLVALVHLRWEMLTVTPNSVLSFPRRSHRQSSLRTVRSILADRYIAFRYTPVSIIIITKSVQHEESKAKKPVETKQSTTTTGGLESRAAWLLFLSS